MKITRLLPVLMFFLISLTGCEKDLDTIESFGSVSKLVVKSIISPQDEVLRVAVQKTQPAIGKKLSEDKLLVTDATVTLSDGTTEVRLIYNPDSKQYEADARQLPIIAGKTYYLSVKTPDGSLTSSSCTIPDVAGIDITDSQIELTNRDNYYYNGEKMPVYALSFKWSDAPDVKNYYQALATKRSTLKDPYGNDHEIEQPTFMDYSRSGMYNDLKTDERIITSDNFYVALTPDENANKDFKLHILLVVCDENYYRYKESLYRQGSSGDNQFAEPVIIYTNIEGGLGVFAGYNQIEKVKEME